MQAAAFSDMASPQAQKKSFTFANAPDFLTLESGEQLGPVTLAYETWGTLSARKDNVILIAHAFSGGAHAASHLESGEEDLPGWWDFLIGPGKAIDTNRYFVVCSNILGSCMGSTGPSAMNPKTGTPYGLDFPMVTIGDMVQAQKILLDHLGIKRAHIVGASMGGMIAQIVAAKHGARARSLVSIMSSTNRPGLPQAAPEITGALITPPASPGREDRIAHFKTLFRTIGSPGFPATEDEIQTLAEGVVDRAPYDPAGIGRQLVAILSSEPRHEMLKAVRCPALVLHGADDPLIPIAGGEDTAASIPGAEFVAVPGMGHDFTEALMPEFIRHAGGFLTRAEQRGKAA